MKGCLFRDRKGREKVVFGVGCSQGGEWEGGRGGPAAAESTGLDPKKHPRSAAATNVGSQQHIISSEGFRVCLRRGGFFLSCCSAVLPLCGFSPCQQAPNDNDDEGFCPSPRGSSVGWIRPISRWRKAKDITSYLSRLQRRQSSPRGRACVVYLLVKSPPLPPPRKAGFPGSPAVCWCTGL